MILRLIIRPDPGSHFFVLSFFPAGQEFINFLIFVLDESQLAGLTNSSSWAFVKKTQNDAPVYVATDDGIGHHHAADLSRRLEYHAHDHAAWKKRGEQREGNDEQEGTDSCGVIILYVCKSTGFRVDCKNAWVNDIFIALVHEILDAAITHAQR